MLFLTFFITTIIFGYSSSCSDDEIETECVNPCNTCEHRGRCNSPSDCQQGCDCKPGLFRDENGDCIPDHQCPAKVEIPRCPKNAMFLKCCPSVIPSCENPYPELDSDDECVPGCACRPGFLRRRDEQCVTPDQCNPQKENPPPQCPKNAIFIECGSPCPPTCNDMQPKQCEEKCITACYCKPGYLARKDGICVKPMDCHPQKKQDPPPQCPKNAIFIECGSPCPPTCDDMEPKPCEEKCITACYCKPGYLARKDGVCVKPIDCNPRKKQDPPPQCPKNAIFIECGSLCPPTCDDLEPKPCEEKCTAGCYCKPGYLARKDGVCVKPVDCNPRKKQDLPPQCPKNAIFIECGSPCPPTCDDMEPKPCEEKCTSGCYCKPGYLARKDGICVKPVDCNPRKKQALVNPHPKCGADEQFYKCKPSCKNTCENIYNPEASCRCGSPGCFCKEGLVKNHDGKCIPPDQCKVTLQPDCKPDEQFYECPPACKNTCENFKNRTARCYCGPPGCFCREGLVKRADGNCVPPNECVATIQPECGADQQFYECTPSCKNTCSHFQNPGIRCGCGPPGCFCKEGLVKRSDGKCVPPSECPAQCPENEEPSNCVVPCNDCKMKGNCQFFACNKGCDCKKGYFRNKNGRCILASFCPKIIPPEQKCGPDERFYNCTPSCKNTCKNFFNPAIRCGCRPPGCFCKEGLVKRADGKCIPPNQCYVMKPDGCPKNAEFSICGPLCRPTCNDPYPAPCAAACIKGCFCKSGFVQTIDGRCVLLENCNRKCSRDLEEFQECGSTCPDTCENRGRPTPGSCFYRCVRGCFCKKGLYRTKSGNCVTLRECDNERYFITTSKPTKMKESTDPITLSVPDDCHGCPALAECEDYCKSLGNFNGLCTGEGRRHCRCT